MLMIMILFVGGSTTAESRPSPGAPLGSSSLGKQTPEQTRARLRAQIPAQPGITLLQPAQHRNELVFENILHELHVISTWKLQYALQRSDERLAEFIYMQDTHNANDNIDALTESLSSFRYHVEVMTNDIAMIKPSAPRYRIAQQWYSRTLTRDLSILQQSAPIVPESLQPEIQQTINFLRQKLAAEARRGLLINPRSAPRTNTPSTGNPTPTETPPSPSTPTPMSPEERKKVMQERVNALPPGTLEKLPPEVRQRILDQLK